MPRKYWDQWVLLINERTNEVMLHNNKPNERLDLMNKGWYYISRIGTYNNTPRIAKDGSIRRNAGSKVLFTADEVTAMVVAHKLKQ